ncbi:MAG: glycosyltransferase [Parvibaculaceae bacterium]|nr:glycosyltransferase [Parvibaculaceae bacterium]
MLSVIIPTLNAEETLPRTLSSLVSAAVSGLVREVIIVDGGSTDGTLDIIDASGAQLLQTPSSRSLQLAKGAAAARHDWMLFLRADTVLGAGWDDELANLFELIEGGRFRGSEVAGAFRFELDDFSGAARVMEKLAALRCALLRLPYGNQGLLVSRALYRAVGGYREMPVMEDVDLVRRIVKRIGRARFVLFRSAALASPARYRRDGFLARGLRKQARLALFCLRVPPSFIARLCG